MVGWLEWGAHSRHPRRATGFDTGTTARGVQAVPRRPCTLPACHLPRTFQKKGAQHARPSVARPSPADSAFKGIRGHPSQYSSGTHRRSNLYAERSRHTCNGRPERPKVDPALDRTRLESSVHVAAHTKLYNRKYVRRRTRF
ncbi:hypothetical protein MRX96_032671 [Rhipicephalus microplus]